MIKAALVVESRDLTLDEISQAMGRLPDSGTDRGSLGSVRSEPRSWASWSIELSWPAELHGGTEGLAIGIVSLGFPLAERVAGLKARGCDVVISIVQELADGDPSSTGLNLPAAAIQWIAAAGASMDVDQYVVEGPEA